MLPALIDEAEVDGFLVAQTGQLAAHGKAAALVFSAQLGRDRCQRRRGRQVVVTHHARHFFNQIFFDGDVKAVRRRRHRHGALGFVLLQRQTQTAECIGALRLAQGHTNHPRGAGNAQRDRARCRQIGLHIADGADTAAANALHQGGDALDVLHGVLRIDAALKAVASVGGEVVAARAPRNRLRPPKRSFDVDVLRVVGDGGGVAAHDAGQRLDLALIGNHADLAIDGDGGAVQQLELLTGGAPAHIETTLDFVEVKNMRWPTQLKHHVVRNIDQRRDAALTTTRQAIDHPLRCGGTRIDTAHDATGEATAQIRRADSDGQRVAVLRCHRLKRQRLQWCAGQGRQLARHAVNAQRMR